MNGLADVTVSRSWAAQLWREKWTGAYSLGIGMQKKPGDVGATCMQLGTIQHESLECYVSSSVQRMWDWS